MDSPIQKAGQHAIIRADTVKTHCNKPLIEVKMPWHEEIRAFVSLDAGKWENVLVLLVITHIIQRLPLPSLATHIQSCLPAWNEN